MNQTFNNYNLDVLDVGISNLDLDEGWFTIIIELSTKNGGSLNDPANIKINIYDDDGIIFNDEYYIDDNFSSYDTISIPIQESQIAFNSKKIKLFATIA